MAITQATASSGYDLATSSCALVDRSARGKLALTGPDAGEFLNGQVTNEIANLHVGAGCYATFLTHKGKMLGDLRVLAVGQPDARELLLDTERTSLQALFDMIRRFKVGHALELHKRTLEGSLLSLVGPRAREVAARASDHGPLALPAEEHANVRASIEGAAVLVIASDVGVDLLFDAGEIEHVTAALVRAGAHPIDQGAAEIIRVERGRPRYGVDLDEHTIPQEAGLNARAVSFTKGCYVGQETVARLFYRGKPNRHLRGLVLSAAAASGDELRLGERSVGRLGSSVVSPRLGAIGLALVRREAQPGSHLSVGEQGITARVTDLPFPA